MITLPMTRRYRHPRTLALKWFGILLRNLFQNTGKIYLLPRIEFTCCSTSLMGGFAKVAFGKDWKMDTFFKNHFIDL